MSAFMRFMGGLLMAQIATQNNDGSGTAKVRVWGDVYDKYDSANKVDSFDVGKLDLIFSGILP